MLQKVSVHKKDIHKYVNIVGEEYMENLYSLAGKLKGYKISYISSSAFGGGVAELLSSFVPLLQDLGLNIEWRMIYGDRAFFEITKGLHNALQGGSYKLTNAIKERYLGNIVFNAQRIEDIYDIIVVNDPQPAALPYFSKNMKAKWVWRSHIDSSEPDKEVLEFLLPYINQYNMAIFTLREFILPGLKIDTEIIWPAIDILSTKNMDVPKQFVDQVITNMGIDINKPTLLQVSRFDPWKDPLGVIKTYKLVKKKINDLQLVLIGAMAQDDPQGWEMYATINEEAIKDENIYVFTNMTGVGNLEVNAFQRGCDVVVQKSLKEGFGLVVSEAMWKKTPVVAGRAGGIVVQMREAGILNNLVDSVEEAAEKIIYILEHPEKGKLAGIMEHKEVTEHFLMPRLIKDELTALIKLIESKN
jgi:trehalose synthase